MQLHFGSFQAKRSLLVFLGQEERVTHKRDFETSTHTRPATSGTPAADRKMFRV